jgi:hypothetical protein
MSATAAQTPRRVVQIAEEAATYLGVDDTKKLAVAIAEIANDELHQNTAFAAKIRALYQALDVSPHSAKKSPGGSSSLKNGKKEDIVLIPVKRVEGYVFRTNEPPDPYVLYELYGREQFPDSLRGYSLPLLRGAVEIVQKRHPGTKPRNMGRKADIIAYLVEYVAG